MGRASGGTLHVEWRTSVSFECRRMTIYRTRYRDPKEHRWVNEWAETRVAAELCRAEVEKRYSPRKLDVQIERFELNPGKSDVVRFLNEVAHE